MKTFFVLAWFLTISTTANAHVDQNEIDRLENLSDGALKNELRYLLAKDQHSLGYKGAKKVMFEKLDNHEGEVCGVYTSEYCIRTKGIPKHTIMNAEHTWPQSMGAVGVAKADLHHLYPTNSKVNSTRSNYPFCEVRNVKWQGGGSKMGTNAKGQLCFEPPVDHRGNVARSMFYFATRYNHNIDRDQERVLRQWHDLDPVDEAERIREREIENHQRNVNLYVRMPELVNRIDDI